MRTRSGPDDIPMAVPAGNSGGAAERLRGGPIGRERHS